MRLFTPRYLLTVYVRLLRDSMDRGMEMGRGRGVS